MRLACGSSVVQFNAAAIYNTLLVFHALLENLQLISPSRAIVY